MFDFQGISSLHCLLYSPLVLLLGNETIIPALGHPASWYDVFTNVKMVSHVHWITLYPINNTLGEHAAYFLACESTPCRPEAFYDRSKKASSTEIAVVFAEYTVGI